MRRNAANAAAFVAEAMNAVTGVGAPWYTSGVHMWNGAAATLKPEPDEQERDAARRARRGATRSCVARKSRCR